MMDMSALITRFSETINVISVIPAHYDENGDLVAEVRTSTTIQGHLQPISGKMQRNDTSGTYSEQDKVMYSIEDLNLKSKVTYQGQEFEIMERKDYSVLGNYYIYVLRGVDYQ